MHKNAAGHVRLIVWGVLICVLLGWLTGELAWMLVTVLTIYLVWSVWQAVRLYDWLYENDKHRDVPESFGLWGDLFDGLYKVQKQNQKARQRLKSMIDRVRNSTNALKEAVVMTNEKGEIEWWNDAAGRLLGFREENDEGQLVTNLIRDPSFRQYYESKDYEDALELSSPLDPHLMLRVYITLFGKGDRLIFVQDVTRIAHLEQMRRDFVSNVSHELRTPLTVLHGYIETLQDSGDLPQRWQRALGSMADQTQRMDILVSDLLLLEKVESQGVRHVAKEVDIERLLGMICHDATLLSGDRQHCIRLNCATRDRVMGEENQLRSAFSNLIYNAVKYTPDQGQIDVCWYRDQEGAHLSVRDTGCGFDPVHIPRLTERFYRADPSRNNNTGGSGLGLAIVKHVLINHGASLEIQSEENIGSEFTCHFPTASIVAAQQESA